MSATTQVESTGWFQTVLAADALPTNPPNMQVPIPFVADYVKTFQPNGPNIWDVGGPTPPTTPTTGPLIVPTVPKWIYLEFFGQLAPGLAPQGFSMRLYGWERVRQKNLLDYWKPIPLGEVNASIVAGNQNVGILGGAIGAGEVFAEQLIVPDWCSDPTYVQIQQLPGTVARARIWLQGCSKLQANFAINGGAASGNACWKV